MVSYINKIIPKNKKLLYKQVYSLSTRLLTQRRTGYQLNNMPVPVLEIQNLTKKYRSITEVNNLSLQVNKGEVFGLLGPNGSGKTTTLGVVTGITQATQGDYQWFSGTQSADEARLRIGTLLETPNFYPYMNAIKNLEIVAHIKKVKNPRIDELLDLVNLTERKKSPFKTYSLGMKQRLAIAGAMIGDPDILIFDEPTNGLDPQGIAEIRTTIQEIASMDKTIIMASHILDEVEKICSHVAIIKKGQLLAQGTVGAIISDDATLEINAENIEQLQGILTSFPQINNIRENPDEMYITYWMKIDNTSLSGAHKWRALWEYKTKNYGSGGGFRMIAFIYTDNNGKAYWNFQGDRNPSNAVWEKPNFDIPVPRDEWFKVEYYFKWSEGSDGRAFMKVNGQLVGEHHGATTANSKDLDFIILTQVYGDSPSMHQWVDDIEIWDGLPY